MKVRTACCLSVLGAWIPLQAAAPVSALQLLDGYLAEACQSQPAYRTGILIGSAGSDAEPGRRVAVSPYIGRFTYRARIFAELDPPERARLLGSPGFRAFVLARDPAPVPPGASLSFRPEDLLAIGPTVVRLSHP